MRLRRPRRRERRQGVELRRDARGALQLARRKAEALARVVTKPWEGEPVVRLPPEKRRREPPKHAPASRFLARELVETAIEEERAVMTVDVAQRLA